MYEALRSPFVQHIPRGGVRERKREIEKGKEKERKREREREKDEKGGGGAVANRPALQALYTSSGRPHTLVAQGLIH